MAHVLVADDDADIRFLLEVHLTRSGHDVVAVPDGVEALAAYAAQDFDIAVLDVSMPRQSGVDVVRAVRAGGRRPALPILLLTALAQPQERDRGLAAGADDYMTKPFSLDALVSLLEDMTGSHPPLAG